MNYQKMTDFAVAKDLGKRLEQLRLEKNLTQQYMADQIGLSRLSYRKLESGEAKLVNFIAALRVLGNVSALDAVIPESVFSPMELLKLKGKPRKRASKPRSNEKSASPDELEW
ncbi:helix-turn-helix transcriptional regulator [Aliikangiella marina]|uniref:Helix-turn-helix transcriptional regulator n=1 Tax=Aliikangiella marina TaxID=1712262 RepID=A0A545TJ81_9GAMM|nr:helix-turn-helix transcriptional regulator [Aliikangiella marina]TQV77257.1 helix-turn-helix transcriptional regulator [Aliikangiella marina]